QSFSFVFFPSLSGTTVVSLVLLLFLLTSNLTAHLDHLALLKIPPCISLTFLSLVIVIVRSTFLSRSQ
ncbi:hypothetical protein L873DRAFT_1815039, partial [Choiromyces venosus 120613-1]